METSRKRRRRIVVDTSDLAKAIGARMRAARLRAGLTQQQLAEGRYTKAYVSALENGLVKPSMVALDYFAGRLGLSPTQLMTDGQAAWNRLEADLHLAAGRWQQAADACESLLASTAERSARAELLTGLAEARARLDAGAAAISAGSEAAEMFRSLGRAADAARADYWSAFGHYLVGNAVEARALLQSILAGIRAGLSMEPDFHLRVVMALASVAARDGDHATALAYLEEVRSLQDGLDDRRRATFFYDLAYSYRRTGDLEAAIRAGYQGLALFRGLEAESELAALENELALAFLAIDNLDRATEYVASSKERFERLGDERWLGHVIDTEARIALARADVRRALELADEALAYAERSLNDKARVDALVTKGTALKLSGRSDEARSCYARAAETARASERPWQLREVLSEWADLLAELGEHREAYELSREALRTG